MKTTLLISLFGWVLFPGLTMSQTELKSFTPDSTKAKKQIDKYPTLDLYGAIPLKHSGGGGGMGIFGPAFRLGNTFSPLYLRIGGEFYITELSHRSIINVPLSAPQTGEAKVRLSQNTLGFNLVARFSGSYSQRVTPYGDLFIGANNFWTGMRITPYQKQEGYEESSSESIANSWHLSYGLSGGVMWGLGKYVKLNTGLMYLNYFNKGQVLDISKASINAGSINTENVATPKNLWVLKVGLTFIITEDENKKRNCRCDCDHGRYESRDWGSTSTSGSTGGKSNGVNVNVRPNK